MNSQFIFLEGKLKIKEGILSFIIPSVIFLEFTIIGRLFFSEVIIFFFLLLLFFSNTLLYINPVVKKFIFLIILWLLGQIFTDIYLNIPFEDWSRGWAKICFFAINFLIIFTIIKSNIYNVYLFTAGLILGLILTAFFNPGIYTEDNFWKFGIGFPVTMFFALVLSVKYPRNFFFQILLYIFMGFLNIYLGYRSLGLVCLISSIIIFYFKGNVLNIHRTIIKILLFLLFLFLIAMLYGYLASNGFLGDYEQDKYLRQSSGKYGLLFGSRAEYLVSSRAILDSPLIGHGSWAKNEEYSALLSTLQLELGYATHWGIDELGLIPSHSFLMGAWVESGIFGAIFWFYVLFLICKLFFLKYIVPISIRPLFIFCTLMFSWDILFSQFGAIGRIISAFYLSLICIILSLNRAGKN
jgi:hypothetical protein